MTRAKTMRSDSKAALTPKLRFPEFRNDPAWADSVLGERSEVLRGGSPRPIDGYLTTDPAGLNWLKIGDVEKGSKYVTHTEERVRRDALSKTREVNPGDLILSNSMSFGRPYILQIKSCIHDGWIAVTEIGGEIDSNYLYYFISSAGSQAYFEDNAAGGGVRNLNAEIIKALPLAYPRKQEQQKIAECLSTLDELIGAERQKLDALKAHKKGLMQQLFPREGETRPRLRFAEFQDASDWEGRNLDQLVSFQSGGTPSKADPVFWNGAVPWVTAKDMKQLWLDDAEDHISAASVDDGAKLAPSGSLLLLVRGMTLLKDVPVCIVRREMSFNQDVKALRPADGVDGLFLALLLTGSKDRLLAMVTVAGHGTGKLDTDELKAMALVLPSPAEQHHIADCLSSLDDLITAQGTKLEALATHKRGLMQQLFPAQQSDVA